jgi:hypothetical protein
MLIAYLQFVLKYYTSNGQYHIFIQYKTEWLNGQWHQIQLDIYVIRPWINRLNNLVDILGPRYNDLNNVDTKGSRINTSLTWIFLYLLDSLLS